MLPALEKKKPRQRGQIQVGSRDIPLDTLLVNFVLGCATFSAARHGLGLGRRKSVSDDVVDRIFAITRRVSRKEFTIHHHADVPRISLVLLGTTIPEVRKCSCIFIPQSNRPVYKLKYTQRAGFSSRSQYIARTWYFANLEETVSAFGGLASMGTYALQHLVGKGCTGRLPSMHRH